MGQYDDLVERGRLQLAAEEWANTVKAIHAHRIDSMHYDNFPEDTENGSVIDIEYNSGLIHRTCSDGRKRVLGSKIKTEELLQNYERSQRG